MIPDMTIGQLMSEASSRWGEIWDPQSTRMTLLLLCPRKERKMMELHGDMVEHGQPVVSVFHRPRAEAHLLNEQGFDPRGLPRSCSSTSPRPTWDPGCNNS